MTSQAILCLIIFVAMIALTLVGVPVAISLFGSSIVGFFVLGGSKLVISQVSGAVMQLSASYTFAVIPMFIALGALAGDTGIAGDALYCMNKWLCKRKGGLLYALTLANGIFGACSGVSSAASMVFAKIAYPTLHKRKYDDGTSLSCIIAAGSLSSLIPPSVTILMICMLADMSISKALLCGFAGGLLVILTLFLVIFITIRVKPGVVPPVSDEDRAVSWCERGKTLKLLLPIGLLFALIVLGPYLGWFPSTVGGAIGMMAMLIYSLIKRVPIKKIFHSLWDGTLTFAGVYMMEVGGQHLGSFVTHTGLARDLAEALTSLNVPTFVMTLIFMAVFVLMGCFMNVMPILTIMIPVVFPVMSALGVDLYALMVICLLLGELGGMTPPVGMGVMMVGPMVGVSPAKIFKGMLPFFFALLLAAVLMAIFPQTILWLPTLLGG